MQQTDPHETLTVADFLLTEARQQIAMIQAGMQDVAEEGATLVDWCDGLRSAAVAVDGLQSVLKEYEQIIGYEPDDLWSMVSELRYHLGVVAGLWVPPAGIEDKDDREVHLGLAFLVAARLDADLRTSDQEVCRQIRLLETK